MKLNRYSKSDKDQYFVMELLQKSYLIIIIIIIITIITFQTANPDWESQMPKTRRPQQGRQPSKEREKVNFIKSNLRKINSRPEKERK